jgi:peptide deformylase
MAAESGVGIAAPQVGVLRNVFLFMRFDQPDQPIAVAINPRIVSTSPDTYCFERDGCLSVPDRRENTRRYQWIDVEYTNEHGLTVRERLFGGMRGGDFTGVIFQHEFDHLRGILYTDRIY